jgi:hypothetical protein
LIEDKSEGALELLRCIHSGIHLREDNAAELIHSIFEIKVRYMEIYQEGMKATEEKECKTYPY